MKKYLCVFIMIFTGWTVNAETFISGQNYTNIESFNERDVCIENNATVQGTDNTDIIIARNGPVFLHNDGNIVGRIDTNGQNLFLYNTGTISGGITTENGGNIVQIIHSEPEITDVCVLGDKFTVKIDGYQNLNFNSIKNISAGSVVIANSSLVIDDLDEWNNWGKDIEIESLSCFIINDSDDKTITNISSGIENLEIHYNGTDNLHATQLEQSGDSVTVNTERVTDYNIINNTNDSNNSNNEPSGVLEQIRNEHPDDRLIRALDEATDLEHMNNIKSHSYRFNHSMLLLVPKVITEFSLIDTIQDESDDIIGLRPFYIFSDTINDYGGHFYVGNNYGDLYLKLGFNFHSFSYEDDLNNFSGQSYGLDIKLKQKFNSLWLSGITGFSFTKFDADYIVADGILKHNPTGISGYGKIDFGYDFNIDSYFILSPFAGLRYQYLTVTDVSDKFFDMHAGTELKYSFSVDSIKYEYSFSGALTTNGDFYSGIKVGFWSVPDKLGVSLDVAVLKNDIDYNYKISADARMAF